MAEERRTKRRYAHELYPHANEWEVRPLEVEVPYLYARAIGMSVTGTSWFDHIDQQSISRSTQKMADGQIALMADAMHQGLTGQEAWDWAINRMVEDDEWVYARAMHYGVEPSKIKPYPCGPEPEHHDHRSEPDARGWQTINRVQGRESDCIECTEPENEDTK